MRRCFSGVFESNGSVGEKRFFVPRGLPPHGTEPIVWINPGVLLPLSVCEMSVLVFLCGGQLLPCFCGSFRESFGKGLLVRFLCGLSSMLTGIVASEDYEGIAGPGDPARISTAVSLGPAIR